MRRRTLIASGLGVAVLGGVAAAAVLGTEGGGVAGEAAAATPATVAVERGDLVDTVTVGGTLGHGTHRPVVNAAAGTLTALPAAGAVVRRGAHLYEVDREPVVLMYAPKPMHRTLRYGVPGGADVRHLEANLRALGHKVDVDERFDPATVAAVRAWQKDAGLPVTGEVTRAQVVFLPGEVRVREPVAAVGAAARPGQTVLTVTGTRPVVTVALDAGRQNLVGKGAPVKVELPGEVVVAGKIAKVGTVAKTDEDGGATVDVEVTMDDLSTTRGLDQAPVSVELRGRTRRDVLSVPIEALLALRAGGYGLEVVEGVAVRTIPVTVGVFASGRVEVSGTGLREGVLVGVPAP
ncbi:peptidoglycan-binding protein [Rhizohabitans arisaemae]|uniref:peptidoglycan-binding protein n=1 Tax=Rhizohabitans arisaemae TaxID=2720610 RepID=UPI0024B06759|nr:peptidoglycan-binding protein [Rhizohabitans arisaemae]